MRVDQDTPGGVTYYIVHPTEETARPTCFRQKRQGINERCSFTAGYKTWHVGTGACYLHGGGSPETSGALVNGKKSKLRVRLQEKIDGYLKLDRAKLLDLTEELAVTKAVFNELLEKLPEPDADDYGIWFHRFSQALGMLGNLVEKIARVDNRNSLTAAQVLYLRATVADILMKYIPDPDNRERAAKELASRMGGDVSVSLASQEYSLPREVLNENHN